jgi:hypothetical protein
MPMLVELLFLLVLLAVGAVGDNIDGAHMAFSGDHFADNAFFGNYWDTNGTLSGTTESPFRGLLQSIRGWG